MAFLNKDQIEEIVKGALKAVADFDGSINAYEFTHFHDQHKKVFLEKLKIKINEYPYVDGNKYYDVALSLNVMSKWDTIQDCINYIDDNHKTKNKS